MNLILPTIVSKLSQETHFLHILQSILNLNISSRFKEYLQRITALIDSSHLIPEGKKEHFLSTYTSLQDLASTHR